MVVVVGLSVFWWCCCRSKLLVLEVQQGSRWEERTYALDELRQHSSIKLYRSLPDLSDPLLEGSLDMLSSGGSGSSRGQQWGHVLCVVKGQTLYVFSDEAKLHVRGVLHLGLAAQHQHYHLYQQQHLPDHHEATEAASSSSLLRAKRATVVQVGREGGRAPASACQAVSPRPDDHPSIHQCCRPGGTSQSKGGGFHY